MDILFNMISVGVISAADGPVTVTASDLPLPAIAVSVFAVAFIAYVYIAKAINAKKAPADSQKAVSEQVVAAAPVKPAYTGPVLTGVQEKEAAVIMAIVSDKTGIPLERLAFKSIKLMEDK